MKAILKFDLTEPDDRMDHLRCVKSLNLACALWEFAHNARKSCEYAVEDKLKENKDFDEHDTIDLVFDKFFEILEEQDVKLEEIIN